MIVVNIYIWYSILWPYLSYLSLTISLLLFMKNVLFVSLWSNYFRLYSYNHMPSSSKRNFMANKFETISLIHPQKTITFLVDEYCFYKWGAIW